MQRRIGMTMAASAVAMSWIAFHDVDVAAKRPRVVAQATPGALTFQVDPLWPQPLPNGWVLGSVTGVAVDERDHVWIVHRGAASLTARTENGLGTDPPTAEFCCRPAPPVLEFDPAGKVVSSWGGPGDGYDWPESPGGIAVDAKGTVWIAAAGFPERDTARRPWRARRATRNAATASQAGRCACPPIHARRQVRATDRQAGRDRGEREPDVAQSPCRARHRCRGKRALRRRRPRQPPHRRVRRHERRVQAALGRLRRRPRRCNVSGVRSGGAAGKAVPDGQLRDDRQKRHGLRLRSAEQPHPGVRQRAASSSRKPSSQRGRWPTARSGTLPSRPTRRSDTCSSPTAPTRRSSSCSATRLAHAGEFGAGGRWPGHFFGVGSVAVDSRGNVFTGETFEGKRVQKFAPRR